jgi:hypothetical protein
MAADARGRLDNSVVASMGSGASSSRPYGTGRAGAIFEWHYMLDAVRERCSLLASADYQARGAAYVWLRQCHPFRQVCNRFRNHGLSLLEVAQLLAPGRH